MSEQLAFVLPFPSQHSIMLDIARPFLVFNDDGTLSDQPVTAADLEPGTFTASGWQFVRDCAWSSNVQWAFVIRPDGIALVTWTSDEGWFCRKRSSDFFRLFLEAPFAATKHRTATSN